ncbi:hypothetical protein [Sporosarcina sp. P33]|uniref:hypothetical protein n=1 Tax=Sporosarcina sp. P33 TaxID=1930764 RepID=UPI0009C0EE4D|nr:hypothetical protein [Sporosarcina sp. P33]ARD47597.1 hypothetical protein SporoP33_04655 [Sporosarcina sp. P33]
MDQVLLDSMDIDWAVRAGEPELFRELWNNGEHIEDIAKNLKRKPFEIALMVLEQAQNGLITERSNGIFGGEIHA